MESRVAQPQRHRASAVSRKSSRCITGRGAYSRLKFEGGVHRVQRVPATEGSGRIHTSAVTVAVMPEADDVEVNINEEKDLRIDVMRASGPGGQSVNTTDSAVRITHIPSGMVIICRDEKSQHKNKARALKILRARLLELAHAEQDAKIAETRRSMVGHRRPFRAHPHLQLSAIARHRPSRQPDAASARPGARRRDRSTHRCAEYQRAGCRSRRLKAPARVRSEALRMPSLAERTATLKPKRILEDAIARLSAAGVDSPRLDAELLLAFAAGVTREALFANSIVIDDALR